MMNYVSLRPEINECVTQPAICHNQNRSCLNTDGSYICVPCTALQIYNAATRQCVGKAKY